MNESIIHFPQSAFEWKNVGNFEVIPYELAAIIFDNLDVKSVVMLSLTGRALHSFLEYSIKVIKDDLWLYTSFRLFTPYIYDKYRIGPHISKLDTNNDGTIMKPHHKSFDNIFCDDGGYDSAQHLSNETMNNVIMDNFDVFEEQDYEDIKWCMEEFGYDINLLHEKVEYISALEIQSCSFDLHPTDELLKGLITSENIKYISEEDAVKFGKGWGIETKSRTKHQILIDVVLLQKKICEDLVRLGHEDIVRGVRMINRYIKDATHIMTSNPFPVL